MPTFLKNAHPMDKCRCDLCGQMFPRALIHEHHVIKRASGGNDLKENIVCLDASCHNAVHQVETAFRNQNRRGTVGDLVAALFPQSMEAQRRCLELAACAAMVVESSNVADYNMYDNDTLVYLTPPRVTPKVRSLVKRVVKEMRSAKTGKRLGVSDYIKGLVEADLKKRGFTF